MCRNVTFVFICKSVFVGVQNHLQERNDHGKHHPDIDHLDISGGGQALGDAKEATFIKLLFWICNVCLYSQGSLDKKDSKIDFYHHVQEAFFKDSSNVADDHENGGGDEDS